MTMVIPHRHCVVVGDVVSLSFPCEKLPDADDERERSDDEKKETIEQRRP